MSGRHRNDVPPGGRPGGGDEHRESGAKRRTARHPEDGQHGTGRPAKRSSGALAGPLAGVLGLVLLLAVGTWALLDGRKTCGADSAVNLDVATAPDIAPAIAEIVRDFNAELHEVDGRCVRARSKPADPAATATLLSGQGSAPGQTQPDIWIPDSSLWVTLVHASPRGGVTVTTTSTSVAQSPIVAALPQSQAARLEKSGARPTWNTLLQASGALGENVTKGGLFAPGSVRIQALDPARNAGGLAPLMITYMTLQNDPGAKKIMAALIRGLQHNVSPDSNALFAGFKRDARGRWPVAILPEQAVWKFNRAGKGNPAVAVYPTDGTLNMNYPFTLVSKDPDKLRAAEYLRTAMAGQRARATVQRRGFRDADGSPGGGFDAAAGVSPKAPRTLPAPRGKDVDAVVKAWGKLTLGTRMLALLDVSGSMGARVPGGGSRLAGTVRAAYTGLSLYPNDNEVGVWLFSTRLDGAKDYQQLVPVGPLGDRYGSTTRRQQIVDNLGRVRPKPNGDTGLYDSIWAGYQKLQGSYQPDKYNVLLILTDGANDDADGISLKQLLSKLRRAADRTRPIIIIPIGVGPDIDLASMSKIAKLTGGKAYGVAQPQAVQKVFIDVIARRTCTPNCSAGGN